MAAALARSLPLMGAPNLLLSFQPDEVYRAPTDDGAAIALGRYHPRGPRRFDEPVLLCHGMGANRFHLDFDEHYSLARHLARRGFEAWVLELRGRGLAGTPVDATFDDEAQHDVSAALRVVRATGADKALWVGHSKGGLLAWAHLARNPDAPIAAVAALGSPVVFDVQPALRYLLKSTASRLRLKSIPLAKTSAFALLSASPGPFGHYILLEENTDPEVTRRMVANVTADIPGGVARQFARWMATGRWDGEDGFDYARGLSGVRAPSLLLAGAKDLIAPPSTVSPALKLLGGPTELVVAGRAYGFVADYGHADLPLGRRSPEEIFPVVTRFLEAHGTPCAG
ncbi:MAG: alpha/beta fold hydrolase [Myxococcaceae bacterium]